MRPTVLIAATGRLRFLQRRLRAVAPLPLGIAFALGFGVALAACGGGDDAAKVPTIAKGGGQLSVAGKVAGTMAISGSITCAPDGSSEQMAGNVGALPVALSIGRTKTGQTYTFPQSGDAIGAFITFVSNGATTSTWVAGSDAQPGKGTVSLSATGGSINLDLTSAQAADGTEHVSGSWTCGG